MATQSVAVRAIPFREHARQLWLRSDAVIAAAALAAILSYLVLHYAFAAPRSVAEFPLAVVLVLGGVPLLWTLLQQALALQFGSDLLAGLAIITSVLLGEYLIAAVVVLMLSGGQALEHYATRHAPGIVCAGRVGPAQSDDRSSPNR